MYFSLQLVTVLLRFDSFHATHGYHENRKCGIKPEQTLVEQLLLKMKQTGGAGGCVYSRDSRKNRRALCNFKSVVNNCDNLILCL